MNFIKKSWQKVILFSFIFFTPVFILYAAGDPPSGSGGKIVNPIPSITSVPGLIQTILEGMLKVGIPIVALAIIYCGFLFVSARGNPEKLTEAKNGLLWSIVGAAILLGALSIAKMIEATVKAL